MPISLRDDVSYIILKKIAETEGNGKQPVDFQATDFTGRQLTVADFLGHLDYLNQKQYINADFTGNAYANQEDVPDAVNPDEVDFRVANTLGAEDGPLPHLIRFKQAELTEKGGKMLAKMNENPPQSLNKGPITPIATKDMPFLEKVMLKGELEDIFDARDLTIVVYRTMRDVMSTETSDRVAEDLGTEESLPTSDKSLQNNLAQLWKDNNPIVSWLSRIRQPLEIKDETFIFRIEQEGGLPKGTNGEKALKAIFSATKEELPSDRIQEVSQYLPGKVKQLWEAA
ncbi:MAG: DUF2267 domain-containing protein [Jaaginema sp. PMC 1079.18]|nr:DUF2267 domain-containing protein [Jaaginema sp. PMC 1080.18]MEC4851805.1 DUF2267 domain-containing protein [Jaaginema sp. PMC 1079.18]MEC4867201.1 DUF2267 domain-containing protein [Jaaginema sp. PMC 1078.18]